MKALRTDVGLLSLTAVVSATVVIVLPDSLPALRTPFGLLLLLLLPGAALTIAIRPAAIFAGIERLLLWLSLSIATSILTAIALNALTIPLRGPAWALTLMAVTLVASNIAWKRRRATVIQRPALTIRPAEAGLCLLIAGMIAATALIATDPSPLPDDVGGTTALWLVPSTAGQLELGVQSQERRPGRYLLQVQSPRGLLRTERLDLAPGQRFTARIPVRSGDGRVTATLYADARPRRALRRVTLRVPVAVPGERATPTR